MYYVQRDHKPCFEQWGWCPHTKIFLNSNIMRFYIVWINLQTLVSKMECKIGIFSLTSRLDSEAVVPPFLPYKSVVFTRVSYFFDLIFSLLILKLTWTVINHCTRQPYFYIELLSETGYWLDVCHGWFHLHGLPQAARSGSEIYKMKNYSCPQRDLNSRPLDLEANAVTIRPWGLHTNTLLKLNQIFPALPMSLS